MYLSKVASPVPACVLALLLVAVPATARPLGATEDASGGVSTDWQTGADASTQTTHAAVVAAEPNAATQNSAPPKKRENAFLRALAAPFRALARLFGGSKKDATAKRVPPAATETQSAPQQQAQATATPQPIAQPAPPPAGAARPDRDAKIVRPEIAGGNTPSFTEQPAPLPPPLPTAQPPATFTPMLEGVARDPLSQGRALLERGYTNEAIAQLSIAAVTSPDLDHGE